MPAVNLMIKPASGLCDMRCAYCFYADEMERREVKSYGVMSEETLEQVIQKSLAYADRECTIAFQGGEPTLAGLPFYRKCLELEKKYNRNGVKISHAIQTNGYHLDQEWCDFLASNHFLTGVSLDGVKGTHDAFRKGADGEDTYLQILEHVRMLERAGADVNILTVVHGKTAPMIRKIYSQYQKKNFQWQQYIACIEPVADGNIRDIRKTGYTLTAEMYGQFLIDLFGLWEIDFYQGRQPYIRMFENYIGILTGHAPEACEQRGMCGFQCVVEADGKLYPCDFYVLDQYRIGNLREDSFGDIVEKWEKSGFGEDSFNQPEDCRKCQYFYICRGGCRRQREDYGEGEKGRNRFCRSYQMFFEACLPKLKRIAEKCLEA